MSGVGRSARRMIITAAPPTPNGDLHLGHLSGPYSGGDILARACRLQGVDPLFITGSDLHQSYVPVKAAAAGLDPLEMAGTFAAEIASIFAAVEFVPDAYVLPQRSGLHVRMVREFFARLNDRGALRERTEPGLFCRDCQRYLFEAYVTGRCPHCGAASDGNSCENCALPNRCVDLVDPTCVACGGRPEARPVTRLVFPLGDYASRLRSFHAAAHMSPQLEALCTIMLSRHLPDIPVSHPTDWGIKLPVPGFQDQRAYVWAEMLPGYFAELAHALKVTGGNPADWSAVWNDPATDVVQFFGFDNGYFHAVLQPALLMAYDPSFKLPAALVTNEFYQLGSSKFSTSRRHAIWASDLLAAVPASAVRFVLAYDRPEAERTSFGWTRFGHLANGVLVGGWQAWLGDLFGRLAEHADGQIPAAGRLNHSHEVFLKALDHCAQGIIGAYRPESFSPRRAARLLCELVRCAADFAVGQARTRDIGGQDPTAGSALAVEVAAALALAKLAAPIMPAFASQLWAALGEDGPIRWDGVRLAKPGNKVQANVPFFTALPDDLEEVVMTAAREPQAVRGEQAGPEVRGGWRVSADSVDQVDQAAWDWFASAAELEFSLDYQRYADAAGKGDRVLLTAWDDRSHHIVGAMAVTRVTGSSFLMSRPAFMLGGLVREDPATLESAYEDALYPAVSVRNICDASPFITVAAPERTAIEAALIDAVIQLARTWGMRSMTFLPVSPEDATLRTALARRGFAAATYTADAVIDLRSAQTVDDYLRTLPKKRRGNARNEISKFRRRGFGVEEAGLDLLPVIVRQEADTWARHGDAIGFDRLWRLRAPLAEHLAGRCRLLVCRDSDGQVAASAIHLLGRDRYHCFTYGAPYPALPGVYGMMTVYEPARYAIEHGLSRLMLGDTALHAKTQRGAVIRPLRAYTLAFDPRGAAFYRDLSERLDERVRQEIDAAAGGVCQNYGN